MAEEPTRGETLRVTVYGSCVARDSVDLSGGNAVTVADYVARQSLLSSGHDASDRFPVDADVAHRFQRRMLEADFAGDLEARLRRAAPTTDVLMWDLTDERHGVYVLDDGSVITRSIDLISVPQALAVTEGGQHLPFGAEEHFEAWSARASKFKDLLVELDLFSRSVVIRLPWALIGLDGEPTPPSMGINAVEANEKFERYYKKLAELGFGFIEIDDEHVIADPQHRWGSAPFHYAQSVYDEIMQKVIERSSTV
ncbi:hypothetical protein C1N80_04880 [Brachybacterium sp. SGAir0954]|uniref:DUF6270 domain-containing protein n=1 Tax=Brachybacterium sp. SGAir0954 TaxID=2571029 RepID=UPI0010CCDE52|nr:DUF6270 domain-containing protein [Brachybacterium sp. SGAir0954]QCR52981.1 hypothetical protein C1N80_04880 [Brachybacterium sp. SGAir0954]